MVQHKDKAIKQTGDCIRFDFRTETSIQYQISKTEKSVFVGGVLTDMKVLVLLSLNRLRPSASRLGGRPLQSSQLPTQHPPPSSVLPHDLPFSLLFPESAPRLTCHVRSNHRKGDTLCRARSMPTKNSRSKESISMHHTAHRSIKKNRPSISSCSDLTQRSM